MKYILFAKIVKAAIVWEEAIIIWVEAEAGNHETVEAEVEVVGI